MVTTTTLHNIRPVAVLLVLVLAIASGCAPEEKRETTPLHIAAQGGHPETVNRLITEGADPNALDNEGKTPLHWSGANGHGQTSEALLQGGADASITDDSDMTALDYARANGHEQTGSIIAKAEPPRGRSPANSDGRTPNPGAPYQTLTAFERAIGGPGILQRSENVWLFAPKNREDASQIVHSYLVKAYDALHDIVGVDTEYVIVVYNFTEGHRDAFGGTSNCVIYYDDNNLRLEEHEEWRRHQVPHISGYVEEMAHNFVSGTGAQFGWEMIGWSIGVGASARVADNPVFSRQVANTRRNQADTFERYRAGGYILPADIAPNLVDRIHAHMLWQCEQDYGPSFWADFFQEVNRDRSQYEAAADRDARYRITVACFDKLPGLNMSERLRANGISLRIDVKSLRPTERGWDRRLK